MKQNFTKAERREIKRHKGFLSIQQGHDVANEEAEKDWLANHAERWRQHRHAEMLAMQRSEINQHVWIESQKAQRDLGREAKLDWVTKYAAQWREWYEKEFEGGPV